MTDRELLTENVRVRLTASEKAELEQAAEAEDRKPATIARRAIRAELDRVRQAANREA